MPKSVTLRSFGAIPFTSGSYNFVLYSEADGHPDALVAQTGDQALTAYGGPLEFQVSPVALAKGNYWLMTFSNDANSPQLCVSTTLPQIKLWQTNGLSGAPPARFPFASSSSIVSYQGPWNVYVTASMPGG